MMTENNMTLYLLISLLLMIIIALSVVWFFNRAQKKIAQSKLKKQELEMTFQRELLTNTVLTKEKERNRISKELHDDVSSQLGIISLNLHALKSRIDKNQDVISIFDQIERSLKSSGDRVRTISHEMMPLMFKKFGLHHTLKELEDQVNLTHKINLCIENDYLIKIKDDFKLLHIYRIIQELINNSLKYSKASHIKILFKAESNDIEMSYEDNGIGFDQNKTSSGLGIGNINTRVALLDGDIKIDTEQGKGFKAIIKYPNYD